MEEHIENYLHHFTRSRGCYIKVSSKKSNSKTIYLIHLIEPPNPIEANTTIEWITQKLSKLLFTSQSQESFFKAYWKPKGLSAWTVSLLKTTITKNSKVAYTPNIMIDFIQTAMDCAEQEMRNNIYKNQMIYNNLLFFHIPKAGGSSIEKMLLQNHKQLDFVIKIIFNESKFSHWMVGTMRNRNWRIFIFWLVSILLCDLNNLWGIHRGKVLHHLTYLDIFKKQKLYLKNKSLQNMTKWCIVRNPYDRIISAYHFLGNNLTFQQFVHWVYGELDKYYRYKIDPFVVILPQWEFVLDENGKNGMNETLHFENLKEDFQKFQSKYNLQHLSLPHINSRKRINKNIKTYYNQELADMVYHMYKWDFKMFNYKRIKLKNPESSSN